MTKLPVSAQLVQHIINKLMAGKPDYCTEHEWLLFRAEGVLLTAPSRYSPSVHICAKIFSILSLNESFPISAIPMTIAQFP